MPCRLEGRGTAVRLGIRGGNGRGETAVPRRAAILAMAPLTGGALRARGRSASYRELRGEGGGGRRRVRWDDPPRRLESGRAGAGERGRGGMAQQRHKGAGRGGVSAGCCEGASRSWCSQRAPTARSRRSKNVNIVLNGRKGRKGSSPLAGSGGRVPALEREREREGGAGRRKSGATEASHAAVAQNP
jgi:hypothetical protein